MSIPGTVLDILGLVGCLVGLSVIASCVIISSTICAVWLALLVVGDDDD